MESGRELGKGGDFKRGVGVGVHQRPVGGPEPPLITCVDVEDMLGPVEEECARVSVKGFVFRDVE
jgi:hypothetical protein